MMNPSAGAEPTWYERAACRARGWAPYFDDAGAEGAKEACARCPVRRPCLGFAITNGIDFGIWGGLSPAERRVVHRRAA